MFSVRNHEVFSIYLKVKARNNDPQKIPFNVNNESNFN